MKNMTKPYISESLKKEIIIGRRVSRVLDLIRYTRVLKDPYPEIAEARTIAAFFNRRSPIKWWQFWRSPIVIPIELSESELTPHACYLKGYKKAYEEIQQEIGHYVLQEDK